jgi:predicted transcriptional regulator
MENLFTTKYKDNIIGTISGFDRELFSGSIIQLTYPKGLQRHLRANHILLKDFKQYAISLAEELKENAKNLAKKNNAPYIYLKDSKHSNEKIVKEIINQRGNHPGLVAVITNLEVEYGFDIQGNKTEKKIELKARKRKCLHIYFYFIDKDYGLCFFRVQTYFPFKVKVYCNGHEKLALDMKRANIEYTKSDNCFTWIDDIEKAQALSDNIDISKFHSKLDSWVEEYVPIIKPLSKLWPMKYHWSIKQIEYSTDIIFKSEEKLDVLFQQLLNYCNNTVVPENVMSFLGKKLSGKQAGRIQSSCKRTYNGFRIKHQCGFISIKIYNKSGNVLRIELTVNDVSQLKVFRDVHHKDGTVSKERAPMEKSIYSLIHIIRFGKADTKRYLDFLSKMKDNSKAISQLSEFTNRKTVNNKNYKGFNPLNEKEIQIFQALVNGALIANGFTSKHLKKYLSEYFNEKWSTSKISRLLKRLIVFNLVKRMKHTYKYFLTETGRIIITMFLKLRNLTVIPALSILFEELLPSFNKS